MDAAPLIDDRGTSPDGWYTVHVRFARSIARGFAWTLFSTATAQAGALLTTILAARLLGQEVFGALGAVQTTAVSLANIASAGLGISATRYLAQTCDADPQRAGRIAGLISLTTLITATAMTGALLTLGLPWSARLFGRGEMESALSLSAIYVFFTTVSGFQAGALLGLQAYRALAVAAFSQTVVAPLLMYGLASSFGLRGAVAALDAAAVWLWLVQFGALRSALRAKGITVSHSGLWEERRVFSRFALPAACSGIIANLAISASTWIVVNSAGGRAQYAQFAAANSLRALILFVPAVVNRVVVPLFAATPEPLNGKFRQSFWTNVQLNAAFALLTAGALIILRGPLLGLFGKHYVSSPLFPLLCAAAVLEVTAAALSQALLRQGALWTQVGAMTLWSVALVTIAAPLADRMGGAALALAYSVSWLAASAAYFRFAARSVPRTGAASGSLLRAMAARSLED
jgi:O-antigen/teichoic acid export membrane protein